MQQISTGMKACCRDIANRWLSYISAMRSRVRQGTASPRCWRYSSFHSMARVCSILHLQTETSSNVTFLLVLNRTLEIDVKPCQPRISKTFPSGQHHIRIKFAPSNVLFMVLTNKRKLGDKESFSPRKAQDLNDRRIVLRHRWRSNVQQGCRGADAIQMSFGALPMNAGQIVRQCGLCKMKSIVRLKIASDF